MSTTPEQNPSSQYEYYDKERQGKDHGGKETNKELNWLSIWNFIKNSISALTFLGTIVAGVVSVFFFIIDDSYRIKQNTSFIIELKVKTDRIQKKQTELQNSITELEKKNIELQKDIERLSKDSERIMNSFDLKAK